MNAQTKKRTLIASMLIVVLCLSLIAGSTFALFTDEHKFNIAVTSGDIEILANAEIVAVYSAAKPTDNNDPAQKSDEFLTDEYDTKYYHQKQDASYVMDGTTITKGTFSNGGDVQFNSEGVLTLNRVTPGDRVDIKINVDNKSDVSFIYRYKIVASDTNLAKGMAITLDLGESTEKTYESLMAWTSEWKAPITAGNDVPDKFISIELPVYAGNEYQSEKVDHPEDDEPRTATGTQSVSYTIYVEAVQANAHLTNNNEPEFNFPPTITPPNYAGKEPTLDESGLLQPGKESVYYHDLRLTGTSTITVDRETGAYIFRNISAATDGALIIADPSISVPLLFIESCDFTVASGTTILQLADSIPQLFVSNDTTINGVRVSEMSMDEVADYFGYPRTTVIVIFPPTVETD